MSHKPSIMRVLVIQITFFSLFFAISDAKSSLHWSDREQKNEEEDVITSRIRDIENIRREIVESALNKPDIKSRDLVSMKRQPINSGRSGLAGVTSGTKGGNSVAIQQRVVRQPRRQVDLAMYEALSKLADVQIADPLERDSLGSVSSEERNAGRLASNPKIYESVDGGRRNEAVENLGLSRTLKNEAITEKTSSASSTLQFSPRKFQCYPIREIYIPKVDKKMPAYACSLGKRAFVISSERFIQDKRDHFEVNVDENTYRRLTPMTSGMTSLTSGVSVLPATLVLRKGEDGYTVRGVNANWEEVRAAAIGDN